MKEMITFKNSPCSSTSIRYTVYWIQGAHYKAKRLGGVCALIGVPCVFFLRFFARVALYESVVRPKSKWVSIRNLGVSNLIGVARAPLPPCWTIFFETEFVLIFSDQFFTKIEVCGLIDVEFQTIFSEIIGRHGKNLVVSFLILNFNRDFF